MTTARNVDSMSKTLQPLKDGGHAFIEGVPFFAYVKGDTQQEWETNLAELHRRLPTLGDTPLSQCQRSIELVQKDGRVSWRAAFILKLESGHVFMGVSEPISGEDVRQNHGLIWLTSPAYTADFADGVEAEWRRATRRIFECTLSGDVPDMLS